MCNPRVAGFFDHGRSSLKCARLAGVNTREQISDRQRLPDPSSDDVVAPDPSDASLGAGAAVGATDVPPSFAEGALHPLNVNPTANSEIPHNNDLILDTVTRPIPGITIERFRAHSLRAPTHPIDLRHILSSAEPSICYLAHTWMSASVRRSRRCELVAVLSFRQSWPNVFHNTEAEGTLGLD